MDTIRLYLNNTGSSIISGSGFNYIFTPASSGSEAAPFLGRLQFFGATAGSYDKISQIANTIAGASYTLRFNLSNSSSNQPSGFRVEASNATVGAVPEPATWAMMLVGFGMVAGAVRDRRRTLRITYA